MKIYLWFGAIFGVFLAIAFWQNSLIDAKVQNEILQNHLDRQNEAIKAEALNEQAINAYNAQSKQMERDFLSSYDMPQDERELPSINIDEKDLKDKLQTLQEVEYALKVFYASSP